MDFSWHMFGTKILVKVTATLKNKDMATCGFKKFHTHPLKHIKAEPSFKKFSLPSAKLHTSGLQSFAHIILPLTGPGLRPTVQILASTKMGGANA